MNVTIRIRMGNEEVPENAEPHDLLKAALNDALAHLRLEIGDHIYVTRAVDIQ